MKLANFIKKFGKVYEEEKAMEVEELHNDLVAIIQEHKASIQNVLFAMDIIKFELMEAKYREIMGVVKLTEKPPVASIKKK
jgi:hypothetical protein